MYTKFCFSCYKNFIKKKNCATHVPITNMVFRPRSFKEPVKREVQGF